MIKVFISHEMWAYSPSLEEQKIIDELINKLLEPISIDCILFNAWVDVIKTMSGNYKIIPKCDQYSTLVKMQSLLPELIPDFI